MKKLLTTFSVLALLFSLNLLFMPDVEARFSGGHSSSSSSSGSHSHSNSSSSYSSGDDDIDLIIFILKMAFEYPLATFICLIIAGAVWIIDKRLPQTIISTRSSGSFKNYRLNEQVICNLDPSSPKNINQGFGESQLSTFKQQDNNFSKILFLDFVHLLYVKYYRYYGKKEFAYLTPYLDNNVQHDKKLDLLISNQIIVISEIIINSVLLCSIDSIGNEDRIVVEFESNYTAHLTPLIPLFMLRTPANNTPVI